MLEAHDVVVMQRSVDLDLAHQLLLGARLSEGGLRNDLGGRDSLGLEVGELVALGKAALAQEFAAEVFLDADVAVELDDLLLYDDLGVVLVLRGLGRSLLLLHFLCSIIYSILL